MSRFDSDKRFKKLADELLGTSSIVRGLVATGVNLFDDISLRPARNLYNQTHLSLIHVVSLSSECFTSTGGYSSTLILTAGRLLSAQSSVGISLMYEQYCASVPVITEPPTRFGYPSNQSASLWYLPGVVNKGYILILTSLLGIELIAELFLYIISSFSVHCSPPSHFWGPIAGCSSNRTTYTTCLKCVCHPIGLQSVRHPVSPRSSEGSY